MNNGLFSFPPGKNITTVINEFESSGNWVKPTNAKILFIEGTGGGQAGANGGTSVGGTGGAAGVAYQIIIPASRFDSIEEIQIGSGGTGSGGEGGNTIIGPLKTSGILTWFGGRNGVAPRQGYTGPGLTGAFGGGNTAGLSGRVGAWGAGGGGGGGSSGSGGDGGKPRVFQFTTNSTSANTGGGATGGSAIGTTNGMNARPEFDINGFGEGGGGGLGQTGTGGRGGDGRRGSGGGGGGNGSTAGGSGGSGGNGFLRITAYCWE